MSAVESISDWWNFKATEKSLQVIAETDSQNRLQEKVFAEAGLAIFFSRSNQTVLTRGHLAPNSDFVYKEW
jgi:hypothetical protein